MKPVLYLTGLVLAVTLSGCSGATPNGEQVYVSDTENGGKAGSGQEGSDRAAEVVPSEENANDRDSKASSISEASEPASLSPDQPDEAASGTDSSREEKARRESRTMVTVSDASVHADADHASCADDQAVEISVEDE